MTTAIQLIFLKPVVITFHCPTINWCFVFANNKLSALFVMLWLHDEAKVHHIETRTEISFETTPSVSVFVCAMQDICKFFVAPLGQFFDGRLLASDAPLEAF